MGEYVYRVDRDTREVLDLIGAVVRILDECAIAQLWLEGFEPGQLDARPRSDDLRQRGRVVV